MKNKVIRLTEQDLRNIVKESVKNVLREAQMTDDATRKMRDLAINLYPNTPLTDYDRVPEKIHRIGTRKDRQLSKDVEERLRKHSETWKTPRSLQKEEYCWYGNTKPLEQIRSAAEEIASWHDDEDEYFEDVSSAAAYDLHVWAKKVAAQAERFIEKEAHNCSIV